MLRCKGKRSVTTIPLRSSSKGHRGHKQGREEPVSDPEDAGRYQVENQQPVQGQVVGENNIIHQYFGLASSSVPVAPPYEERAMLKEQLDTPSHGEVAICPSRWARVCCALRKIIAVLGTTVLLGAVASII